ncbi:PIN domain-containing protein [Pseudomonas farris]
MPEGMPTPGQLWNGEISFFSIDTDVIQSAGYNFEAGALNQLHTQLPNSMELQLTEVVANEVVNHLMEPVLKSIQEIHSAAANLKRKTDLPMEQMSDLFRGLTPEESAHAFFRKRVEDYAERCRGGILAMEGEGILSELFRRYFAVEAPFELKAAKKSEFPDAAALLVLEAYATDNDAVGIVISSDGGWQAFANQSDYLYCVRTLDELTALFTATGEVATKIHTAIRTAIEDRWSPLRSQLNDALKDHVGDAAWDVGEIYSSTGSRVDAEISDVKLLDHDLIIDDAAIWNDEDDPSRWLVEVTATVKVDVSTSYTTYLWDSIDREEIALGSDTVDTEDEIEVTAYVTCANVQPESAPQQWDVDIEIASGDYSVDVGEVQTFPWEQ